MLLVDEQLNIVYCNDKMCDLFGYHSEELCSNHLLKIIPERFQTTHNQYALSYLKSPKKRAMASSQVLKGIAKNGDEIEMKIGLSTVSVKPKKIS